MKFRRFTTLLLPILFATSASAYHFEVDGVFYEYDYQMSGSPVNCIVVGNPDSPYSGDVTIPASVTYHNPVYNETVTYGVIAIKGGAFQGCTGLTSVSLGGALRSIGAHAFAGCTALRSVVVPEGVRELGSGCFSGCISLQSVALPGSLGADGLVWATFEGCSALRSVSLAKGITRTGISTFYNCVSLESVDLPEGLSRIDEQAFSGCTSLRAITARSPLTHIGLAAFGQCGKLDQLPDLTRVEEVGYAAFSDCASLRSLIFSDRLLTVSAGNNIYGYTFGGCTSLERIELGSNVTSLPNYCFFNCSSLRSFHMPDACREILTGVFYNCTALEQLTVPENCKVIGPQAFYCCTALNALNLPQTLASLGARDENGTIGEVFRGCSSLRSLRIPEGVREIAAMSIVNCTSLGSLSLPSTLQRLEAWSIRGCPLTQLHLPESLTYIGDQAIDLDDLTELTIPANVTEVSHEGLWLISDNLKRLVFADGPKPLKNIELFSTPALESLHIGRNIGYDEDAAEIHNGYRWESLLSLSVGDYVTDIRWLCPYYCTSLQTIECSAMVPPLVSDFSDEAYAGIVPLVDAEAIDAYRDAPVWKRFAAFRPVDGLNAINELTAPEAAERIFTLGGIPLTGSRSHLPAGVYIVRRGSLTSKILIR